MSIRLLYRFPVAICLALVSFHVAVGQQPATGLPPFSSLGGGPVDTINLANLNTHLSIPIFSKAGKGIPLNYSLNYDSLVWVPVNPSGVSAWTPLSSNWGWRGATEAATGYVTYSDVTILTSCPTGPLTYGKTTSYFTGWAYHDPTGAVHPIPGNVILVNITSSSCGTIGITLTPINTRVTDNSGYYVHTNATSALGPVTVLARGGTKLVTPSVGQSVGSGSVTDPYGNAINITYTSSTQTTQIYDTLNATTPALTITGLPPTNAPTCTNATGTSDVTYGYYAPSGATANVTVSYTHYWIQTNFLVPIPGGGSNITEFAVAPECLVDRVTYPDNTFYQFNYESTVGSGISGKFTGRLVSVTVPAGGTVSYSYTGTGCGNNSNCMMADGAPSFVNRTIDGHIWNYSRVYQSGSSTPSQTKTIILDPSSPQNETHINFSGTIETARKVYNGLATSGVVLDYTWECYNGNTLSCDTATVNTSSPLTQRVSYEAPQSSPAYRYTSQNIDQYGNITESDDYGYSAGSNPLLRKTTFNLYTTLCTTSANICNLPANIQVKDGGGAQVAYTGFTYNGNGKTTEVDRYYSASNYLAYKYGYNPDGTVATVTDPKTTTTNFGYTSGICNKAFPTSSWVPGSGGSLYTYYTYDLGCYGAVVTSVKDPNSQTSQTVYSDPYFWRPTSAIDRAGKTTTYSYPSATQVESTMVFNSGFSAWDFLTTTDDYGRPYLQQKREGVSWTNFDTVATYYDAAGRVAGNSRPATCTVGTDCTTARSTVAYDGANRPISVTAADGGYAAYTYNLNDVLVSLGPAPAGENVKTRNLEYDALGHLTSVCEVTGSGSGACGGQAYNPGNGFITTYVYDPVGNLKSVNQNGTAQIRSFNYDQTGRLLQEINPENGTTAYTYDTDSTCSSSSTGDMVKKIAGTGLSAKTTCFYYDALHRLTDAGYGPGGGSPVCRRYKYDSGTVNGNPLYNIAGRLYEAKTDNCAGTTFTDEGFSYSARGEVTDVYESTPNSGSYYHVNSTYWDNGVLDTLSGIPGVPTITYGANQGGRPYTVSAATGTNPITSAAYNAGGQLLNLTFGCGTGSGDTDAFQYDPLTGRQTQYKYNVGTAPQVVQGTLGWNPNGTLSELDVADGTNPTYSQNCSYTYDDLIRVNQVSCQKALPPYSFIWNQSFGYDAFGNISKTGSPGTSFLPTYTSSPNTNQFASIPGVTGTLYDSFGNLLKDGTFVYTWDQNWGNVSSVADVSGTTTLTFDALGRMVEQAASSGYTQILYGPTGNKLALMSGSALRTAFVPLIGGAQGVYTASGLSYYRHSDWLGSSRLAVSSSTRSAVFDGSYAPFGEPYGISVGNDLSFTGQNQDTKSGLYDFLFREQNPVQGRWASPDPAGAAAVDITNPQTWNRYAYVANNPLNAVDPEGLYLCETDAEGGQTTCDGNGVWAGGGGGGGGGGGWNLFQNAANEIEQFYGGEMSFWSPGDMITYESQQFWQQQKLCDNTDTTKCDQNYTSWQLQTSSLGNFLPQNQNPKAQSSIWESQYISDLPKTQVIPNTKNPITGQPNPPVTVYATGSPLPQSNPFYTRAKLPGSTSACTATYRQDIRQCDAYPPGPGRQSCIDRAQNYLNGCVNRALGG